MEDVAHKPPWQIRSYPWGSMGWRMGMGETYWEEFVRWFLSLDQAARVEFASANPEPPDWKYFYEYICLKREDRDGHDRLFALIRANQRDYQSSEYERGLAAEKAGDLAAALKHYHYVNQHGDFKDVAERYERIRLILQSASNLASV
jgi:hypothetical protein